MLNRCLACTQHHTKCYLNRDKPEGSAVMLISCNLHESNICFSLQIFARMKKFSDMIKCHIIIIVITNHHHHHHHHHNKNTVHNFKKYLPCQNERTIADFTVQNFDTGSNGIKNLLNQWCVCVRYEGLRTSSVFLKFLYNVDFNF